MRSDFSVVGRRVRVDEWRRLADEQEHTSLAVRLSPEGVKSLRCEACYRAGRGIDTAGTRDVPLENWSWQKLLLKSRNWATRSLRCR